MITSKDKISIKQLKNLCKLKKLTKYSNLKKDALLYLLNSNISSTKIQRFLRKRWIGDNVCLITMEPVVYPCFAFKPKGFVVDTLCKHNASQRCCGCDKNPSFVYYNLDALVQYLIATGDFRDPKTREPYSDNFLKSIDKYKLKVGLKSKSVYKASTNKKIYKRKKEREEDLIILERCLDEVVSSMRSLMEIPQPNDPSLSLNSFHFPTYHRYFRNLLYKSHEYARQVLQNTIQIISGPEERPTPDPNKVKDFILQFIFTLESTYFEI